MSTGALFHLEMDVFASWNNAATCIVQEPHLARLAADHCIHLLETIDPEKSWKVRATNNSGSKVAQVFVTLSALQSYRYRDLLVNPLRAIADTSNMFSLW